MESGLKATLEQESKKVYSPEKNAKFSNLLNTLRLKVMRESLEDSGKLEGKIVLFNAKLRGKYNVMQYAMMHAFMGSGIDPNRELEILYDDFPGDDSVEKFINDLIEEYK